MKTIYFIFLFSSICLSKGYSQLTYTVGPSLTNLTNYLQGIGLTISNMTVTGAPNSFGFFSGTSNLPFGSGIIMSSGSINNIDFPASTLLSSNNAIPGSVLGNALSGGTTFDECRIEFDCVPSYSNLLFDFAFASEEYNEYVGSSFNDVFGIFVSGPNPAGGNYTNYNCAIIPGTTTPAVSVNSINNGLGAGPCVNCSYYIDNTNGTTVAYDGFTAGLQGLLPVIIGQTYHFTIIIDDVADGIYDSSVMFQANSFNSTTQCAGNFTCNISPTTAGSGKIIIYKKSLTGAIMDSVGYQTVSTPSFTMAIPDSGRYILKFIPSSPLYQISYSDTAKSWNQATVYNNICSNSFVANFFSQPYDALVGSGNGAISGKIVEGQKYGQKTSGVSLPGTPIGGVIVKGGKNPGGQLFAQTTTNSSGDYTFSNLPNGDYFVLVDIPGLDTASSHHVSINGNQLTNLGFVVDSAKIVPSSNASNPDVSVKELNSDNYSINIYPNPATTQFKLQYTLLTNSFVKIELYNLLGKSLKVIQPLISQPKGDYNQSISLIDLETGIYFLKQIIDNYEVTYKLIVVKE